MTDEMLWGLRNGGLDLRPIIDRFATVEKTAVLAPFIGDPDLQSTVLYILSELPKNRVDLQTLIAVRAAMPNLSRGSRERLWAEEIIRKFGFRTDNDRP